MATDFEQLDAVSPRAPEELPRQWALGLDDTRMPEKWPRRACGGWCLAAHPDAHVAPLEAADGVSLGWVMEPMLRIGPEGTIRAGRVVRLDVVARDVTEAALDRAL